MATSGLGWLKDRADLQLLQYEDDEIAEGLKGIMELALAEDHARRDEGNKGDLEMLFWCQINLVDPIPDGDNIIVDIQGFDVKLEEFGDEMVHQGMGQDPFAVEGKIFLANEEGCMEASRPGTRRGGPFCQRRSAGGGIDGK